MFESFQPLPGDPILALLPRFQADPRPAKVNLGIGLYYDDSGALPVMQAVREALARRPAPRAGAGYLPMAGNAGFSDAAQRLAFGADCARRAAGQVATIQTLGGTGALKVGADVLRRHFPESEVWVGEPSWDNHRAIFEGAGFTVRRYPYFDPASGGVDLAAMLACLDRLPPHSIVLLHACCHNPTGADPTPEQWAQIAAILLDRRLIPFFDFAYQGFGDGIDEDALALRALAEAGADFLVAQSFSKNFALYGERCGALSFVCASRHQAALALGEMEHAVRRNYSSPPAHGAGLIAAVLQDAELAALWRREVDIMRRRIERMRRALGTALAEQCPTRDFSHLRRQRGMFGYSGLSPAAVAELRERHAVYLVDNGRLCLAGLNSANVGRVAAAIAQVTTTESRLHEA